ncbi:DUF4199 domain-containing protein [Sphingobacterium corticis]|uniref:DUF4199 domain-containing protein n=1 Tax=Sphingobacterium corticis TaxID=1812823 RepID=A0ABW5NJW4_9SPHI
MTTNPVLPNDLKKKAAIFGLIIGAAILLFSIASLVFGANATGLFTAAFVSIILVYVIPLIITCFLIVKLRRLIGGFWSFRTALSYIYLMLAVAVAFSTVGMRAFSYFAPSLEERSLDNMANLSIEYFESLGVPDEQIDATIAEIDVQREALYTFSLPKLLQAVALTLIMYFILALILAAIFKKEQPMFVEESASDPHPWKSNEESNS